MFTENTSKLSSENLIVKIKLRDPKTLVVKPSSFRKYKMFFHLHKPNTYSTRNRTALSNSNPKIDLSSDELTYLFKKYFTKSFQQMIVVIANNSNVKIYYVNSSTTSNRLDYNGIVPIITINSFLCQSYKIILCRFYQSPTILTMTYHLNLIYVNVKYPCTVAYSRCSRFINFLSIFFKRYPIMGN
jgi:hypothetical protein